MIKKIIIWLGKKNNLWILPYNAIQEIEKEHEKKYLHIKNLENEIKNLKERIKYLTTKNYL